MKQLRKALVDLEVGDEELLRRLTQNGETPDIVLAALLKIFDFYLVLSVFDEFNGIVDRPWLYELSGEAFDRVFELVAEASGEDTKEVKAMLYRSVIQHASGKIAEIYSGYEDDIPNFSPVEIAWDWPVVELSPSSGATSSSIDYQAFSALKMFGYTVGKTKGWPQEKRRRFLTDFMRMELPSAVSDYFGDEYGSPMSSSRLRKIANLLASFCNGRDPNKYHVAIQDWEDDLDFLKITFYEGHGLKFVPWPDPRG